MEDCRLSLHIRQIYPGAKLQLTCPTGPRVDIESQACALVVTGSVGRERVRQRVAIVETACHFGGVRSWFGCPGCGERAVRLFFRGTRFACRKCSRLVYSSSYRPRPLVQKEEGTPGATIHTAEKGAGDSPLCASEEV